ncbi:MAG TPA: M23 family metallopeptidase, partial [Candidatus Dormibacteraeota bacterium]|nr:M23 family metallopeptidase [Candidatus Dormibacteraeota bacterium]
MGGNRYVPYAAILSITIALLGYASIHVSMSRTGGMGAQAGGDVDVSGDSVLGGESTIPQPISTPSVAVPDHKPIVYTTKGGDTIASIARTFRIPPRDAIWSNPGLRLPLKAGRTLELPPVPGVVVRVKEGDSLESLGATYGVDEATITGFNDIGGGELIPGTTLVIPVDPRVGPNLSFGVQADPVAPSELMCPIPGSQIIQKFGPTSFAVEPPYAGYAHFHLGVDLLAGSGTPIHAAAGGKVTAAGYVPYYGVRVEITDSYGLVEIYAHMAQVAVQIGQLVQQNEVIGFVGSTGLSTGPHLHLQLMV